MHRLDARAVDLAHVGGVDEHEGDDAPEEGIDGHAREPERRDAEAEQVDDEDRRDPRKMSAYTTAKARSGKNTGPGSERRTAMTSAQGRISASAIRKILTFTRNASGITSSESWKTSPLKKAP